ncbi:hypothetical protein P3H15_44275 [Rhodococcus sp. T2V]|uniref:hypothetical protein n=1 Tax=Rhodococcus sp. T2V TaxID=3034164 RepID=UPI0023E21638|nr:hypothetical protein [Rhodococcus sp. T2V]MDF3311995.1 hypothetical protein [Rhodococcus sp. T2V]
MTNNENLHPQDDVRTIRSHAGEAITDSRNWPGYTLIGTGIAVLGLFLVAAGYGFTGWAWIAVIICILCLVTGATLVLLEHRRVKRLDDEGLMDQQGH